VAALGAALAVMGGAWLPASASANHSQIAVIQDVHDAGALIDPQQTLAQVRALGASTIRVIIPWATLAPSPGSIQKPSFDASDPNAYPASGWAPYDAIVQTARQDGLTVDLTVSGGAPRWAEGKGVPGYSIPYLAWKPNAQAYGEFVYAVGERYDGHFTPTGASSPLPRVSFWAIFEEPNFGEHLAPQALDGSRVSVAPMMYRRLVNAGFSALKATGHGRDTILIGELNARGMSSKPLRYAPQGFPGIYGLTKPLAFIRTLYCVNSSYRQLRDSAAKRVGCPTTPGGSSRFRGENPGLFEASGVGAHPEPDNGSPVTDGSSDPNFATIADLGRLETALDSWKNPRVASYMQYLQDPAPTSYFNGFSNGLETYSGQQKATYGAYRLPLYLPYTSFSSRANIEVWGDARPAPLMQRDGNGPQTVSIQLNDKTIRTVKATGSGGYFDLDMSFPTSGSVRLAYTYPRSDPFLPIGAAGSTVYSRSVVIKVH
jgi:hypothetical protein